MIPRVDAALRKLGAASAPQPEKRQPKKPAQETSLQLAVPDDARLTREAMRVLRRLREAGAVLAVAPDLDKAVVVRDMP
ncbi:MAG: helix-turn-helix domain containing protein, partial [Sulfitobacter sp.]|nr:helix-turn-helix domain containing protein [Sulfitobacter sp.]